MHEKIYWSAIGSRLQYFLSLILSHREVSFKRSPLSNNSDSPKKFWYKMAAGYSHFIKPFPNSK